MLFKQSKNSTRLISKDDLSLLNNLCPEVRDASELVDLSLMTSAGCVARLVTGPTSAVSAETEAVIAEVTEEDPLEEEATHVIADRHQDTEAEEIIAVEEVLEDRDLELLTNAVMVETVDKVIAQTS